MSFPATPSTTSLRNSCSGCALAAPNIVGVKSSNPDLLRLQSYIEVGGEDFVALCGVDGLMLAGLAVGARGQVSGNSNAVPELFRGLYDAFRARRSGASAACATADRPARAILQDGLHPAYFKAALTLRGVPAGQVRAPMRGTQRRADARVGDGVGRAGGVVRPA